MIFTNEENGKTGSGGAPADDRLREAIESSADGLGLSTLSLPGGAGHDARVSRSIRATDVLALD